MWSFIRVMALYLELLVVVALVRRHVALLPCRVDARFEKLWRPQVVAYSAVCDGCKSNKCETMATDPTRLSTSRG